jgi:hypothetical protein
MKRRGQVYIDTAKVARMMSTEDDHWTTERARRWLQRNQAAVKVGARYFTTRSKLRLAFPDFYQERFLQEF